MEENSAINSIIERANLLWSKGDFEGALGLIKAAYHSAPSHTALAFEYGHILGELSSGKASEAKAKFRSEAIEVLARLCENMHGMDPVEQWKIRRHYYLYSGQHLQNRSLGHEEIRRGNQLGVLSIGFGCLHHAIDLLAANKLEEAQQYATEGKEAFEKLLIIDTPKYGRLLSYALVLALLGKRQEAIETTSRAAALLSMDPSQLRDHNEEMSRLLGFAGQSL